MHPVRASVMPERRLAIIPERLESCVRRLEPSDRALLDLSLNRGIPDAAMAPILKTDPMRLAWKRARAIERIASRMGLDSAEDIGAVRAALMDLPSRAWMPLELQPAKAPPQLTPPEPANAEIVVRQAGIDRPQPRRMARARRRVTAAKNARRAVGALAIAATAALAFRRR